MEPASNCADAVPAASNDAAAARSAGPRIRRMAARILLQGWCPQRKPAHSGDQPRDRGRRAARMAGARRPDCQFGSEVGDDLFVRVVAAEPGGRVALRQLAEVVARDQPRGAHALGILVRRLVAPPRATGAGQPSRACADTGGRRRPDAAPSRSDRAWARACRARTARDDGASGDGPRAATPPAGRHPPPSSRSAPAHARRGARDDGPRDVRAPAGGPGRIRRPSGSRSSRARPSLRTACPARGSGGPGGVASTRTQPRSGRNASAHACARSSRTAT